MKKFNKTLAILMAALTCVGTMNVAVFADVEDVTPQDAAAVEETVVGEPADSETAEPEEEIVVDDQEDAVIDAQEDEDMGEPVRERPENVPEGAMEVEGFYIFFADTQTSDYSTAYTATKQKPSVSVMDGEGKLLLLGTDYKTVYTDNINVGTAYVYITGLSDKSVTAAGTKLNTQVKFTITPVAIPKTIKLDGTSFPYAAEKAICPTVTIVGLNNKNLVKGTDFTVKYTKNKAVGTAKVTVTGKGNYKGTASKSFKIVKCPASKLTVKLSKTKYTYTGKSLKPSVTVYNGKVKVSSKKYKVSYSNNVKPGTAAKVKVTMTDTKHYTGYKTAKFTIKPNKPVITKAEKSDAGAVITWNKNVGVDGYYLYRKAGNGSYKMIKKTTETSYTDTSVKLGGSFRYYVVAYKGTLKSAASDSKLLTIKLPTPEITKAEPAKTGGIRLQTKLSGAQLYEIYRCDNGKWSQLASTKDPKEFADWIDKSAKKRTTYDYQVISWSRYNSKTGKYDAKAYSNIVRATCVKVDPSFGQGGDAVTVDPSEDGLRITWAEVDGIEQTFEVTDVSGEVETGTAGYEVQFSLTEDFDNAVIITVTKPDPVTGFMNSCLIDSKYIPEGATVGYVRIRTFQTIDGTTSKSDWGTIQEYDL